MSKQESVLLLNFFFSNRFGRPIGMLTEATIEMRQTVGKIDDTLRLEHKETLNLQTKPKPELKNRA